MGESNESRATDKKAPRKRSIVELTIVWGGILILLAVVLMEWTSMRNFAATLEDLESAIQSSKSGKDTKPLAVAELHRHVHGFAFQSEVKKENAGQRTFQWPSLFKFYKLGVSYDSGDRVFVVETCEREVAAEKISPAQTTATPSSKPPAFKPPAFKPPPLPKQGLAKAAEQTVALTTTDLPKTNFGLTIGSLSREVIRQGLLIAAREELGLSTLDASLGEAVADSDSPQCFPFDLKVEITRHPSDLAAAQLEIEISRPNPQGKWFRWESERIQVSQVDWLESLVEQIEVLSRKQFVSALQEAGFQKVVAKPAATSEKLKYETAPMDFVSQYALIRKLHAQMESTTGASETIESLICAYANLGHLVDFHWGPASKAMKARSLLYAQRYLMRQGKSQQTLACRAYARALAGRHLTALDDIESAKSADGPAIPEWLDLIEAYCTYTLDVLENENSSFQELAAYLRMRLSDPVNNVNETLKWVTRFSALNPACLRTAEMQCEVWGLGIQRAITEVGFDQIWPDVHSRLGEIPDMPQAAKKLADQENRKTIGRTRIHPQVERRQRMKLITELQNAGITERYSTEFSWTVLADLLRDVTFLQVWRRLEMAANVLGLPADNTVAELKPLFEGHRLAPFLMSFVSDPNQSKGALQGFIDSADVTLLDLPAAPIALRCYRLLNPQSYTRYVGLLAQHADPTFEDLSRRKSLTSTDDAFNGDLRNVSPYQPAAIVRAINYHWDEVQGKSKEWEKTYGKSPLVLQTLAARYRQLSRFEEAKGCLNNSIEACPTHAAYQHLAGLCRYLGDVKGCRETLEDATQLPDYGLEGSQVQIELANLLMREGDWDAAEVHANEGAKSYSGWALLTAARCAEGIEKWPIAEAYHRAASQRYLTSAANWYFWCLRTGHGNVAEARLCAQNYWKTLTPPYDSGQIWSRAVGEIVENETAKAIETLTSSREVRRDLYALMLAAVLADKLDRHAERDSLFEKVGEYSPVNPPSNESPVLVELVNLFRTALAGNDKFDWDQKRFEIAVFDAAYSEVTYLYYFAGEFLGKHGLLELSREYLECAATSFDVDSIACLLACHTLKEQNIEVGPSRPQEIPDSLVALSKFMVAARFAQINRQHDVVFTSYSKAIKLRPDFLVAILERGDVQDSCGNHTGAIADYTQALVIDPECDAAHSRLAWLLATCEKDDVRNGPEALQHAQKAFDMRPVKTWKTFATLAAAHAECGEFDNATKFENKANSVSPENPSIWERLKLYREKKPYHRPPISKPEKTD